MTRLIQLLAGPEFVWLIIYAALVFLIKYGCLPAKTLNNFAENLYLVVPLLLAGTFLLWYVPFIEKDWLLLRVWIAGVLGAHFVLERGLLAHSRQDPGIGMVYIAGMLFAFLVLIGGSVFVKIR